MPVDINAVALRAFDPVNNWLRIEVGPGQVGTYTPRDANQVFTSVFDATNNALRVTCLSGCGGVGGGVQVAGDIGGSQSLPTVIALQARPVSKLAPSNNQVLTWINNAWTPATPQTGVQLGADVGGSYTAPWVVGIQGNPVSSSKPTSANQFLGWNGTQWAPAQPSFANLGGTATASQVPAASGTAQGAITLAKDLGGTAALPQVIGLQGNPVSSTKPTASNQFLGWNGTQWAPSQPSFTNLAGTATAAQVPTLPESQITNLSSDLAAKEATANKNQANGYAGLNASSQIALAQVPSLPETQIMNLSSDLAAKEVTANKNQANGYAGLNASSQIAASQMPLFGASGASHAVGAVPDPGSTASATRYLREDQTWAVPAGGGVPGGANTAIQFNSSGTLGGDATNFSYDPVGHNISVGGNVTAASFTATASGPFVMSGTEGACSGAAAGKVVLCLGDTGTHTAQLALNGGSFVPIPQLAGDLGGTAAAPKVASIQGTPVASAVPAANQVLTYNGSAWAPATPATGAQIAQDLGGTTSAPKVVGLQGNAVASGTPAANQVLSWNGTAWTPTTPTTGAGAGNCSSNQFVTGVNLGSGPSCIQPSFSNLSGVASSTQLPGASSASQGTVQLTQDLGGSSTSPKVVGLQGNPVSSTTPTSSNQFLGWNGTQWAPSQPSFTNLAGTATAAQVPTLPESQITNLSSDLAAKEAMANKNQANGYAGLNASSQIASTQVPSLPESQITNLSSDLAAKEMTANKNQANGYAGLNASSQIAASQMPLFGASGASHAVGAVPDPGSTAGATRYLREDQTWAVPAGGGGGAPGGANSAIQFNNSGTLGGDATNFSYDPVSHNLSVTGQIAAGSFVSTGTGAGYTQWTSGSFSGSAGTVTCGANPGSQFACSANNGAVTPMAMISGDLGGAQGTEQVTGLHLLNEGQLGNQALSTTVPNDGTTGTAQNLLAKISSAGAALKATVTDTSVPVYMVASPTATGGNARLVIGGQGTCIFDSALTSSNLGHYVQASTTAAGDCHDAGATPPSSGWTLGQITGVNGTSGTIQLLQGELPGAGGTGSGTVSSVGFSPPTGFSVTSSPVTTSGTLAFSMPSGWTSGDLLVGNGSNSVARLSVGASGQCLTSNGATATWGTCGTGGGGVIGGTGSAGQIAVWSGASAVTGSSGLASDSSGNLTATSTSTKGNPVFSATAYGCVGDGATDNSTCFSSMLTAMGTAGGKIYFGPAASSYNFGSARTISTNNVTVECAPGVVLKQTTTAGLLSLTGSNDSVLNCTLDHASQNGAPLISASGNFAVINGVVLQNAGVTSPSAAAIDITGGQGSKVLNASSTSIADRCIGVIPAASTAVKDVLISGNVFTFNPGTASLACIYINDGATGSSFVGIQVVHNTVYVGGNNAHAYNLQGASISPNSASQSNQFIGNRCIGMAQFSDCYKMYAFYRSVFAGNLADDANFVSSVALFNFGDAYWTSITGNVARNRAGQGGMSIVDAQGDAVLGNEIDGVGNNFVGIGGNSQSALFSDNIFSGNVVNLTSGKAGICYRVMANSPTFVANDNALVGNHCVGTGTASQIGISIYTNTTTALAPVSTTVRDNQVINVPTGILIDGVSGSTKPVRTAVTPEAFDTVITQVIDNGTGSRIETHFVTGTATLASGRATVTLSGMDVFSSGTSYLCQAADTTTPANAVTVSAYTSGTSFTLAGTGTDVVRYSCRGY